MPNMDGYEATAAIRSFEKAQGRTEVPIIALTAGKASDTVMCSGTRSLATNSMIGNCWVDVQGSVKARCLEEGMNDCVSKPCDKEVLLSVLNHWAPSA